jgi:hypothetical protein
LPTGSPKDPTKKTVVSGICLTTSTTTTTTLPPTPTTTIGPCSSNTCEYTWIPGTAGGSSSWTQTKKCPTGCFCSNINPAPPADPTKQSTISFPCSSNIDCGNCANCEWECVFDEEINAPQWVLKKANGCPTCLQPAGNLCKADGDNGNLGEKACGKCLVKLCEWECSFNEGTNTAEWTLKNSNGCPTCLQPAGLCKADKNLGEKACGSCLTTTPPPTPPICFGSCILNCKNGNVAGFSETQNCYGPCACGGNYDGPNGSYQSPQAICQAIRNGFDRVLCLPGGQPPASTPQPNFAPFYFPVKNKKIFL